MDKAIIRNSMNHHDDFIQIITELSLMLNDEILTKQEMNEIRENVMLIKEDNEKLQKTLDTTHKLITKDLINNKMVITEAVADLNIFFGDIIQELENIQEIINNTEKCCEKKDD